MSHRPGASYNDRFEDEGRVLVYEGHDAVRVRGGQDPKTLDQPEYTAAGTPTGRARSRTTTWTTAARTPGRSRSPTRVS